MCPSAPNPKSTSSGCVQVHPTQRAHLVGVSKCTQPKEHIKWVCPSAPNPKSTSSGCVQVHPTQRAHLVGVSKCTQPKEHIKWVCPSAPNPKSTSSGCVQVHPTQRAHQVGVTMLSTMHAKIHSFTCAVRHMHTQRETCVSCAEELCSP